MVDKGYPSAFARIISEEMHTDYLSERMLAYIERNPILPPEQIADEMLAILSERDRLIEKHVSANAQEKINRLYLEGLE